MRLYIWPILFVCVLGLPGRIGARDNDLQDRMVAYLLDWSKPRPHHPIRRDDAARNVSGWMIEAAGRYGLDPWELLFVCQRESSFIPRQGTHGEVGPGQLHGLALDEAARQTEATVEDLAGAGAPAYIGVAYWLREAHKACPTYPTCRYHLGGCMECRCGREVARQIAAVRGERTEYAQREGNNKENEMGD